MFGNDKLWNALTNRLDHVEELQRACATRHEVEELKRDLTKNSDSLDVVKDNTNKLSIEFKETRRWMGIMASLLAFAIPFVEEIKDVVFHQDGSHQEQVDIQMQNEIYQLRKELETLKK